jgi:hypothetical protein
MQLHLAKTGPIPCVTGTLLWRSALLVAALGCGTTTLSSRGRQVVPIEDDPGARCVPLGTVTGTADPFFGALKSEEDLVAAARNDAANKAAELGATHLRLTGEPGKWPSGVFGGGTAFTVTCIAYRCAESATDPPRGARDAGCTKDTDCKGERICESGRCVAPSTGGTSEAPPGR